MKISDNFGEISRIDYWRNKTSRWKIDRAKNQWVSSKNCWNIDKCQLISKTMKKMLDFAIYHWFFGEKSCWCFFGADNQLIFWAVKLSFWGWQSIDFLGSQVEFLRLVVKWKKLKFWLGRKLNPCQKQAFIGLLTTGLTCLISYIMY